MSNLTQVTFGGAVRLIRHSRGLSQGQVAELVGCGAPTICSIEKGSPDVSRMVVLGTTRALGFTDPDELVKAASALAPSPRKLIRQKRPGVAAQVAALASKIDDLAAKVDALLVEWRGSR